MGQDKALMPFLGRPLILRILERLAPLAGEVILTVKDPERYEFLGFPLHRDLEPGQGALGGLFTSLTLAKYPLVMAVACDLPFANRPLFRYECEVLRDSGADVAIPATDHGFEPLHAVYRRDTCLPVIRSAMDQGVLKLIDWLEAVKVREITPEETGKNDPQGLAFWNVNTPEEFLQAEDHARMEELTDPK